MSRVQRNPDGTWRVVMPKGVHSELQALEADTLEEDERHTPKAHFVRAHQAAVNIGPHKTGRWQNMELNVNRQGLEYLARSALPNAMNIWSPEAGGGSKSHLTNASWTRSAGALQDEAMKHLQQSKPEEPVSTQVRHAYDRLSGGGNGRVRLADLRDELPHISKQRLDTELTGMSRSGHVALYPLDNRPEITPKDEQAALHLSGVPQHVVYMDPVAPHTEPKAEPMTENLRHRDADIYFKKGDVHAKLANDAAARGDHDAATKHSNAAALVYGAAHSIKHGGWDIAKEARETADSASLRAHAGTALPSLPGEERARAESAKYNAGARTSVMQHKDQAEQHLAEANSPGASPAYASAHREAAAAHKDAATLHEHAEYNQKHGYTDLSGRGVEQAQSASKAAERLTLEAQRTPKRGIEKFLSGGPAERGTPQPAPPAQKAAIAAAAKPRMSRVEARAAGGRWETGPKGGQVWVTANGTKIYGRKPKG